jgi:hypothetical protein
MSVLCVLHYHLRARRVIKRRARGFDLAGRTKLRSASSEFFGGSFAMYSRCILDPTLSDCSTEAMRLPPNEINNVPRAP